MPEGKTRFRHDHATLDNSSRDRVEGTQSAVPLGTGRVDRHDVAGRSLLKTDVLRKEPRGLARGQETDPIQGPEGRPRKDGMRRANGHEIGSGKEQRQGFRVSRVAERDTRVRVSTRAGGRWDAKDAAIRGEMAEWEASRINERRGPGKTDSEAVEKGTHGSRVRAGR